jgi:predicted  nucleic acid-binding Zn-ribbon protein
MGSAVDELRARAARLRALAAECGGAQRHREASALRRMTTWLTERAAAQEAAEREVTEAREAFQEMAARVRESVEKRRERGAPGSDPT